MKILLTGDTSSRSNWGCRATSYALKKMLRNCGEIVYSVDMKKINRYLGYRPKPETVKELTAIDPGPLEEMIDNVDVVVINGEGAFFDFALAGRHHLLMGYWARKKPCILINHTSDLRNPRMMAMARELYPLYDDVVYRDPVSYRNSIRGDKPHVFGADAVYTLLPDKVEVNDYIILGGSARFRYQPRDHDSLNDYVKLCEKLQRLAPVKVVAIERQERKYLKQVADKTGAEFVGGILDVQESVKLFSSARVYVGGRWHSAIKALMGGAGVVLMSTNIGYKTEGLRELYNLDCDMDYYEAGGRADEIAGKAERLLDCDRGVNRKISEGLAITSWENVRFLRRFNDIRRLSERQNRCPSWPG